MLGEITNFAITAYCEGGCLWLTEKTLIKCLKLKNMSTKSFNTWKTLTNDNHIMNPMKKYMKIHFMTHQGLVKKGSLCKKPIFLNIYF